MADERENVSGSLTPESIRGRIALLKRGEWPHGKVPYGYDRLYIDPMGAECRVPRAKRHSKPHRCRRLLIKNDEEAKVVEWLYREYLERDVNPCELARNLSSRKIPRPDGTKRPWTDDAVRQILQNKAYAGFGFIEWKDSDGTVRYHEVAGVVPPIVGVDLWKRAAEKLRVNRLERRKVQPTKASPLSGILFCGHCGNPLRKRNRTFVCSFAKSTKKSAKGCGQWRVKEDEIFPIVIRHLVEEVDRAVLEVNNAKEPEDDETPNEIAHLKAKLAALVKRLEAAEEESLGTPPSPKKERQKEIIAKWEEEQAELERQIRNLTVTEGDVNKSTSWWQEMRGQLVTLIPLELGWRDRTAKDVADHYMVDDPSELPERIREQYPHLFSRFKVFHSPTEEGTQEVAEFFGVTQEQAAAFIAACREKFPKLHEPDQVLDVSTKPVRIENARLRNLLKNLGIKVVLFWEKRTVTNPKTGKTHKSSRYCDPVRAEITINGRQIFEGLSRARSLGTSGL